MTGGVAAAILHLVMSNLIIDRTTEPEKLPSVGDYAKVRNTDKTVSGQFLTGYIEDLKDGKIKIYYGPWYPITDVVRFVPRDGARIPKGTQALPINSY